MDKVDIFVKNIICNKGSINKREHQANKENEGSL